jgi:hypothetical protein
MHIRCACGHIRFERAVVVAENFAVATASCGRLKYSPIAM